MSRLVALLPVVMIACVSSGDEGMVVLSNQAVTGACSLTSNPTNAQIGHGTIFSGGSEPYVLTPLIQSRIVQMDGVDQSTRTIQLRGADVTLTLKSITLEDAGGAITTTTKNMMFPSFSLLFAGSLPPSGYASAFIDIIPVSILREIDAMGTGVRMDAEVLAEVTVKGELGDKTIAAEPYFYPVNVCNQCVVNVIGACPVTGSVRTGNACNVFQDGVVDCCTEDTGVVSCPARTATP